VKGVRRQTVTAQPQTPEVTQDRDSRLEGVEARLREVEARLRELESSKAKVELLVLRFNIRC
jgi:hypothetical protein